MLEGFVMQTGFLMMMKLDLLVVCVFTLDGGAISWKSTTQTCIARSTMKGEFIAVELACQQAECLKNLLVDTSLWGR